MSLYKYVVPERIDILCNASVRFSQPAALNDPFEMQPHFETFAEDNVIRQLFCDDGDFSNGFETGYLVVADVLRQVGNMLPDKKSRLEFEEYIKNELPSPESLKEQVKQGRPEIAEWMLGIMKNNMPFFRSSLYTKFSENLGVLSLTEKHDNILMWAHYANNYKGFVIEFEETHEFFSQQRFPAESFGGLKKVEYSDVRPNAHTLTELTPREVFLIKSKEWEYEQEWRMLSSLAEAKGSILNKAEQPILDDNNLPIYLCPIPPSCIKGIIFGSRMVGENQTKISKLLSSDKRYCHVKKYQSVLDEKTFKLHTVEL